MDTSNAGLSDLDARVRWALGPQRAGATGYWARMAAESLMRAGGELFLIASRQRRMPFARGKLAKAERAWGLRANKRIGFFRRAMFWAPKEGAFECRLVAGVHAPYRTSLIIPDEIMRASHGARPLGDFPVQGWSQGDGCPTWQKACFLYLTQKPACRCLKPPYSWDEIPRRVG